MSNINKVLSCFDNVRKRKDNQYQACCPCHNDKRASLSIEYKPADDKILLYCQAGCDTRDILSSVNLSWCDLSAESEKNNTSYWWQKDLIAKYDYTDSSGKYLYSKLRYKDKRFVFARISGEDYTKGKGKNNSTLYNLPEALKAIRSGRTIFYCEGEKDANTLKQKGLVATTAGSVGDWKKEYSKYFIGADLVILPDNDKPGHDLSDQIKRDCKDVVYKIRIVNTSNREHGDISNWFEDDHTKKDLLDLVNEAGVIYPSWIFENKSGQLKVNPALLADVILNRNSVLIAKNPGTETDICFWYCKGVYKKQSEAEIISHIMPYIPMVIQTPELLKKVAQMIKYNADVVEFDDINAIEKYINVKNGLINIKSSEVEDHTPDLISTIQLNCEYNEKAKCPKWLKFLDDIATDDNGFIDTEMIDLLQEWAGVTLSSIFGYRIKRALVLYSPQGNTGKTVFLKVLTHLLGNRNTANVSFQELGASRWATGRAFAKRLIVIGDQGAESIPNSSRFKELTGGDLVSAEFKGLQGFDYVFTGVIIAGCNALPVFEDDKGNHVAERLTFVNFKNVIPYEKRDSLLIDKLVTENDGIFQWALSGLKRFLANGRRFSPCESSEALMKEYRKRYDTLYAFIEDELEYTGEQADVIRKTDFERDYISYCERANYTPLSKKNIKQRANGLGVRCSTLHGVEVYRGVKYSSDFNGFRNISNAGAWID